MNVCQLKKSLMKFFQSCNLLYDLLVMGNECKKQDKLQKQRENDRLLKNKQQTAENNVNGIHKPNYTLQTTLIKKEIYYIRSMQQIQ